MGTDSIGVLGFTRDVKRRRIPWVGIAIATFVLAVLYGVFQAGVTYERWQKQPEVRIAALPLVKPLVNGRSDDARERPANSRLKTPVLTGRKPTWEEKGHDI